HSCGMELHKFHVHQFSAGFVGEGHSIRGVFPGIGSHAPGFANSARRNDDGLRLERDESSLLPPIAERTSDTIPVFEQARDRALHENVNAKFDATVLQRTDQFETSAVADVTEAFEAVATEGTLQNVTGRRAIKQRAPLLELAHTVRRFLCMKLRHAPV